MNLYEAEYQSKRVTIEEALDSLKDGDVIGTSQCANEPTAFFDAIDHLRSSGKHFRMFAPCLLYTSDAADDHGIV